MEPEIPAERQQILAELRDHTPNIEIGVYPFKDVNPKLTRADIEWLLATHEDGQGPVVWHDIKQRGRKGLDLRGATLQEVDLRGLPLAGVRCGLTKEEWFDTTAMQRAASATHLERANLYQTHMEGGAFHEAHLEWAFLRQAFLDHADLSEAHLRGSNLREAHLEGANLTLAHLEEAKIRSAHLDKATLQLAFFDASTDLSDIFLAEHLHGGSAVVDVHWNGVNLSVVPWESVIRLGDEERARQTHLLADYQTAVRANRQLAVVLRDQGLNEVADRFALRAQILQRELLWLETGLPIPGFKSFVQRLPHRLRTSWRLVRHSFHPPVPRPLQWSVPGIWQRWQHQHARLQPLPAQEDEAKRPWYRRWKPRKLGAWLWSLILAIIAGYGYKPGRSLLVYLCVISLFATLYHLVGPSQQVPFSWLGAFVFSITSFHGRGFFPGGYPNHSVTLDDALTVLAAAEALIGLLIEISFIATFTQRFFSR